MNSSLKTPKVSILLPNYNHEKYIYQRIESILGQDFTDFELILLDDASTDNSVETLQKFTYDERISQFIINEENSGSPFVQWKKGLDLAKGEYIWIAESDDIASSSFLSEMVKVLDSNQMIGLAFCPSIWIDKSGNEILRPEHEDENDIWNGTSLVQNEFLLGNLIYNASSAVFRKKLVEKVDFKKQLEFKYSGDWFFWVQIVPGVLVERISRRLNYFRRHENNVSFKSENEGLHLIEGMKIIRHIFSSQKIPFFKRRKIMLLWARKIVTGSKKPFDQIIKKMPLEIRFWLKIMNF